MFNSLCFVVSNHSYHQDTDNSVELNTPHAVSKKGRPRKLSVASGKQGVSQSLDSGGVPNPDENGSECAFNVITFQT